MRIRFDSLPMFANLKLLAMFQQCEALEIRVSGGLPFSSRVAKEKLSFPIESIGFYVYRLR
jgi:hypothetical protein